MNQEPIKWFAIFCALAVAFSWGLYGPALSHARAPNREWGPFKPFISIGIAYLVFAVFGGAFMMKFVFSDNFNYTGPYFPAMKWGFLAGTLGAIGSLFLTLALTKAGGKPAYVMPIVFGGAVTVNAIVAFMNLHGERVSPLMWLGMALVAVGICLTAGYAPHGHSPAKPAAETSSLGAPADSAAIRSPDDSIDAS